MSEPKKHLIQPHYEGDRFYNYPGEKIKAVLVPSCIMYLQRLLKQQPQHLDDLRKWQQFDEHHMLQETHAQSHVPQITWIGHASFLLKFPHCNILLDPVFNNLTWLFPRHIAPGIERKALPRIDVVLISHNHRDHLEQSTVSYLAKTHNPLFLVPEKEKANLESWGAEQVIETSWWETHSQHYSSSKNDPLSSFSESIRFTFLPARHWSQRKLFDMNRSLWGSWMISVGSYHCYFAGDTAYGEHFELIAQEYPQINTAIMPIGPCEPSEFLRRTHIDAEQAGNAFLELNAKHCIPMHWGTFGFGTEHQLAPIERFTTWWKNNEAVLAERNCQLHPLKIGQQLSFVSQNDWAEKPQPAISL